LRRLFAASRENGRYSKNSGNPAHSIRGAESITPWPVRKGECPDRESRLMVHERTTQAVTIEVEVWYLKEEIAQ